MSKFLVKMIPAVVFWGIFIFAILYIPYPQTLTQAEVSQLLLFFIPLLLALSLTINLLLNNIFSSCSISLGLISLLILKALDSLSIVTGILAVVAAALLVSYFGKTKRPHLTKLPKIPKLTSLRRKSK